MVRRWDWLLASIALHTLASMLHWALNQRTRTTRSLSTWWPKAQQVLQLPWLSQSIRMLYGLGLPAAALMWKGTVTSRGLGLSPFDSQPHAGADSASFVSSGFLNASWTLLIATAVALLFACGRWLSRAPSPVTRTETPWFDRFARAALDGLYHQVHWAFYREPFVILLDATAGSWLGLVPVAVETVLNICVWEKLQGNDLEARRDLILRAALWVASTIMFIRTRNLGLAILMHTAVCTIHLSSEQLLPARQVHVDAR